MVGKALEAAETLSNKNISCEVIDLRTIKPLDIDLIINSIKKTNNLVVCERFPFAGISSEIISQVQELAFDWQTLYKKNNRLGCSSSLRRKP